MRGLLELVVCEVLALILEESNSLLRPILLKMVCTSLHSVGDIS